MKKETQKKAAAGAGDEQHTCRYKNNRCKNLSGDNYIHFCQKHYNLHINFLKNNPSLDISKKYNHLLQSETPDLTKKNLQSPDDQSLIPPDEQRCCRTDNLNWRCKNFKMRTSRGTLDTMYCEKHRLKRRRKRQLTEEDDSRTQGIQPPTTNHTCYDTSAGGSSAKIGPKRKKIQGELKSLTAIREPVIELESLETKCFELSVELQKHKVELEKKKVESLETKCFELSVELEKKKVKKVELEKKKVELEKQKVELEKKKLEFEKKKVECTKLQGKSVIELESLEHYKTKCFELSVELEKMKVEFEKQKVELEKKKAECTKLQGKYAEVETRNKTSGKDGDATEYWRNKCSDLESLVSRMETENLTRRCIESRVANLESLVLRNGKDSSVWRCEELHNEIAQTCVNPRDENSGGRKDSHVYDLKTKENVLNVYGASIDEHHGSESEFPNYSAVNISAGSLHLTSEGDNVEEGKGWGCLEERPSQQGSSSGNENQDKMKWKSETELHSSFEDDPELCTKAVCALYRQEIEISAKGLFNDKDTLRCITLAKFLMDNDCKGDLNKSVKELETLDYKAVDDCKMLAKKYSVHLFLIYRKGKDPFFCPATTASHGDQAAK